MIDQLPLNMQLRDDATLTSFYPADNIQVLNAVTDMAHGRGETFLFLWGHIGSGRTHLLQAACHAAVENNLGAVYVPLQEMLTLSPDILQGIENIALVCIDDIHCVLGKREWEEALFHLFNKIRTNQGRLMIAAEASPKNLSIQLADLKSRLSWGLTFQVHSLNDEQKLSALQLRSYYRGLQLDKLVGRFLLSRCPRNMSELFNTLEQLDRASLTEQRRLTIPFVKHVLGV